VDWYLILGGVTARLVIITIYRYTVWVNYPSVAAIVPLYGKRAVDDDELLFVDSTPFTISASQRREGIRRVLFKWIAFPIYEILCMHVASSFAYGALVGWATAAVGLLIGFNREACFAGALLVSTLAGGIYVFSDRGYLKQKWKTLSAFSPRLLSFYAFLLGGGCVAVQFLYKGQAVTVQVYEVDFAIVTIGHGLHLASALFLFIFPYFAAGYHFGFVPVLARCFSLRGGNAGLDFQPDDMGLEFTGDRGINPLAVARAVI
jgi:hypothetical protein